MPFMKLKAEFQQLTNFALKFFHCEDEIEEHIHMRLNSYSPESRGVTTSGQFASKAFFQTILHSVLFYVQ